jgi:hypothetical protein
MKRPLLLAALPVVCLSLTQCIVDVPNSDSGSATQHPGGGHSKHHHLTADKGSGSVTIRDNGQYVTTLRTAHPNVEETRWHKDKSEIAVKSRGNHGPATIQLFDSRSGRQLDSVKAYNVTSGGPGWAAGMGE